MLRSAALAAMCAMILGCKGGSTESPVDIPDPDVPRALGLTPFGELNAGPQTLDSHASVWEESVLVPEHYTYRNLYKETLSVSSPHYTRMTRLADGSWILLYHDENNATVNGRGVFYTTSTDMKKWEKGQPLFAERPIKTVQGGSNTRLYTNGYVLVLRSGEVLAIASFRLQSDYGNVNNQVNHGIALRRSSDNGLTWSAEQEIYHGTNWEAQLLELEDGELQCYFSESRPWISGGHSGTGMIRSTDGGKTWNPTGEDRVGNPYTIAREMYVNIDNGKTCYTYQMPAILKLNDGDKYVGAFETAKNNASGYGISFAYSDTFWTEIVDSDGSYPVVTAEKCGPADRVNYCWTGASPTLMQFPSGETVVGYGTNWNGSYHLLYRMGDSQARNFGSAVCALPNMGSWGQVSLIGTHEMCAVNRDSQISTKHGLSYEIYALNHSICPTSRKVTVDGRNSEWSSRDEALFCGAAQDAHATLRCSYDEKNVYFLVEVMDEDISSDDHIDLFIAPYLSSRLDGCCVKISADRRGLISEATYDGTDWTGAFGGAVSHGGFEGTLDSSSDLDEGYLCEVSVPRSAIDLEDGCMRVNLAVTKASTGVTDYMASKKDVSKWFPVIGIR